MPLTLDHVVVHVVDLEAAIADYRALGFNVQPGGAHADGATHNALIVFADGSYIELIAFLKPQAPHRWAAWARRGVEGFVDFALLPDSVGTAIAGAGERGLAYDGPIDGGRLRPDGERLRWQLGTPPTRDLPFLCGDITPRGLRVREGEVRIHPNGARGIAALTVAVADLAASLDRWRALLGPQWPSDARAATLPGVGLTLAVLALGAAVVTLVAAGPDPDEGVALRERLANHGEGLIGIGLQRPAGAGALALPSDRCHGAAIEFVAS